MSIGLLFWVLMVIWFVFGWLKDNPGFQGYGSARAQPAAVHPAVPAGLALVRLCDTPVMLQLSEVARVSDRASPLA